jgi:hypothetical protein
MSSIAQWRFCELLSSGMAALDDYCAVAKTSSGIDYEYWESALVEPVFDLAVGRAYAEWSLDQIDDLGCYVMLGVTALEAAPQGADVYQSPWSRMYSCYSSRVFPRGSAPATWEGAGQQRPWSRGHRVGLLVEGGTAWVYVNGAQIGGGPMAEGLPRRLRFATAVGCPGNRVRLVEGARPPERGWSRT